MNSQMAGDHQGVGGDDDAPIPDFERTRFVACRFGDRHWSVEAEGFELQFRWSEDKVLKPIKKTNQKSLTSFQSRKCRLVVPLIRNLLS